jgi:hypothetical protein
VRRPYGLRAEPVRCANCRGWFRAAMAAEDGTLVDGLLVARPGEGLPAARKRPWWRRLFAA